MHVLDFMNSDTMALDTFCKGIELDSLDVTDQMVQVRRNKFLQKSTMLTSPS